jgi:acylphosphatase
VALRVLVSGRVQGVGFREACRRVAVRAGASGWVRNLADGRVEVWLEGEVDAVERVVSWCRTGPSWASVSGVQLEDESARGVDGFSVR